MATAGLPGVYEPFPYPVAVSPRYAADRTLFTALYGQFVAGTSHSLYRALDGGAWWNDLGSAPGNPNVFELAATGYGPLAVAAHLATDAGVWHYESLCEERLTNGGFEVNGAGWQLPATPATAVYSTKYAHTGQQSVRTGIDGGANVYSYSSGNQYVAIPAGSASAKLTVWWYPISGEGPLAAEPAAVEGEPDARILAAAAASSLGLAPEEVAPDAIQSTDRQYILLLDGNGNVLKTLLWTRSNARTWQQLTFDLAAYRGVALRVAFGTYNDGKDGATAMYIDDAALTICWPAPAEPTVTPTPTATRGPLVPRAFLPLMLHNYPVPTPTPTPTATYTATPTSSPTPTHTLTPTATATPIAGQIAGAIFMDGNRNGRQDTGEEGLAGRLVQLWQGGVLQDNATTNAAGQYSFPEVAPGDWQVLASVPANYVVTTGANPATVRVTVANTVRADFGIALPPTVTPTATVTLTPTATVTGTRTATSTPIHRTYLPLITADN